MRVAVIGSGNVGSALARAASATGNDVVITGGRAQTVAEDVGARAAASNVEAVSGADLVLLAVPAGALPTIAGEIASQIGGAVVVDATNPLSEDMSGLTTSVRSSAEELADLLPGVPVVKAFNTVFAGNQAVARVEDAELDGFYAGDDEDAKRRVAAFLSSIGYRPVDVGDLTAARALEHMAFLNISLNARNDWSWRSGWKLVGPLE